MGLDLGLRLVTSLGPREGTRIIDRWLIIWAAGGQIILRFELGPELILLTALGMSLDWNSDLARSSDLDLNLG
jgi:hypothetical protein